MKTLALLALVLLITFPAYGQVDLGTSTSSTNPQVTGDATTGLFSSTSDAVSVSSGGTEIMRVNGTGVGIGTTAPITSLTIGGGSNLLIDSNVLFNIDSGTSTAGLQINGFNDGSKGFEIENYNGTTTVGAVGANANLILSTSGAQPIYFNTDGSQRMIIDSSGDVGIGTTSPANLLDIGTGGGIHVTSGVPSSTSNALYNNSGTLTWNGSALATTTPSSIILSAGQLLCNGTNCSNSTGSGSIQYCPYKGNIKTTASQGNYTIPSACLTATLTSMYVGGTASSSVSASTLYYIYLWNTSGTWVLDAETTGHATDSSTGIEIKSGDDTKTLVGMIHTDANKHVMTGGKTHIAGDTNTVATWDNRNPTTTTCAFTADRQVTPTSLTEVNSENRCLFMSWGDPVQLSSRQMLYPPAGASFYATTVISINGTATYESYNYEFLNVNTGVAPYSLAVLPASFKVAEGYNYTELLALTGVGDTITYPYSSGVATTNIFSIQ